MNGGRRIEKILLFGSALTGARDGTVGDLDVVVTIKQRILPENQLETLEEAEKASKPKSSNFIDSLCWPDTQLRRRLAKLSRYLSFHPESERLKGKKLMQLVGQ
jgi:predicted nucleotidyltransferase